MPETDWETVVVEKFGDSGLRDTVPCGCCVRGLYSIDHHEPSKKYSELSKYDRAKRLPKCQIDPSKPCQGHLEIIKEIEEPDINEDQLEIDLVTV